MKFVSTENLSGHTIDMCFKESIYPSNYFNNYYIATYSYAIAQSENDDNNKSGSSEHKEIDGTSSDFTTNQQKTALFLLQSSQGSPSHTMSIIFIQNGQQFNSFYL